MSVTLTKDAATVTLPGPNPGATASETKRQVLGRSAGGTVYTYDKGVDTYEIALTFESLTNAEKAALQSFFHATVDGVTSTLTYTDSSGNAYTARFLEPALAFRKVADNVWDVAFRLELSSMGA